MYNLLSVSADSKTIKGEPLGYLTGILYLQPASLSGKNLCPGSSPGCRAACLYESGRAIAFPKIYKARERKTKMFLADRPGCMAQLVGDISKLVYEAKTKGLKPAIRLGGTSDILFENILITGKTIFDYFPKVQFYDYTKVVKRLFNPNKPCNLHLTFSRSESNEKFVDLVLAAKYNVAVVFRKTIPSQWKGRRVIRGDISDLRFLDPKGVICGLTAKGKAKKDRTGFVVDV